VKSKVTTKHQIQYKETVLVVLESISKIDDKRMVNLFEQPSFLDNVSNSSHLDAFRFVDVFEGIQLSRLLVLDDTNFAEGAFTNTAEENEMEEVNLAIKVDRFWATA
jgi:hypothetical protein